VAAYDLQLRELERDAVEIRNGPTRLGLAEGAGVANLEAERDAELDALGIEGIVAAIVRGEVPQPGYDPEGSKAELANASAQLAHGVHRAVEVDRGDSQEPGGIAAYEGCYLVVRDERPLRSPPGAEEP